MDVKVVISVLGVVKETLGAIRKWLCKVLVTVVNSPMPHSTNGLLNVNQGIQIKEASETHIFWNKLSIDLNTALWHYSRHAERNRWVDSHSLVQARKHVSETSN